MSKHTIKKSNNTIVINIIIILSCFLCAYFFLKTSLSTSIDSQLNYKENSNIDYTVCLKENDFFEETCLASNMKYVANLIDKININIEYNFKTDHDVTSTYTYWAKAKLIIADSSNSSNIIFTKEYDLLSKQIEVVPKESNYSIKETILIKYDEYNILANKFKSTYGVSSIANLEVHLYVKNQGKSLENENISYNKNADLYLSIPLSENSINVQLNSAVINNEDIIKHINNQVIGSTLGLVLFIMAFLVGISLLIRLLFIVYKLLNKKTKYEKNLQKYLKEYDRLIVESPTKINFENYNVTEINKFEELLDVHDNLKLPIIFSEVCKNKKSVFYVKDEKDLYLFVLKKDKDEEKII